MYKIPRESRIKKLTLFVGISIAVLIIFVVLVNTVFEEQSDELVAKMEAEVERLEAEEEKREDLQNAPQICRDYHNFLDRAADLSDSEIRDIAAQIYEDAQVLNQDFRIAAESLMRATHLRSESLVLATQEMLKACLDASTSAK